MADIGPWLSKLRSLKWDLMTFGWWRTRKVAPPGAKRWFGSYAMIWITRRPPSSSWGSDGVIWSKSWFDNRFSKINTAILTTIRYACKADLPDHLETVRSAPSPRFIKSHLPVSLLPDQIWTVRPKLVYIRRNPKSVAVSYYHHVVTMQGYTGTKEQFVRAFMKDQVLSSPYHEHVTEFHHLNYPDNLLLLCFEDMKKVSFLFYLLEDLWLFPDLF